MWRIIFLMSIPTFVVVGLVAPTAWAWATTHWPNLLIIFVATTFWAAKAIMEHK